MAGNGEPEWYQEFMRELKGAEQEKELFGELVPEEYGLIKLTCGAALVPALKRSVDKVCFSLNIPQSQYSVEVVKLGVLQRGITINVPPVAGKILTDAFQDYINEQR